MPGYVYDGDPNATEAPSAAPGPGVVPTTNPPADGDPRNADSVRQMAKVAADFTAYLQKSARFDNPQTPSIASGVGRMFTDVVHDGIGTGTAKPTGGIACYGDRYVVLITLAGATTVAKFKVSTNGGKTYGAEHTTAASYTDASGVTIAFVGTFALNDTYKFRGCDTPMALWVDPSGRARHLVDHLGFPLSQITTLITDWSNASGSAGASNLDLGPGWTGSAVGSTTPAPDIVVADPSSDQIGNFSFLKLKGSTDTGSGIGCNVQRKRGAFATGTTGAEVFAMQWLVRNPAASAAQTLYVGLLFPGAASTFAASHGTGVCFKAIGIGTWHARTFGFGLGTNDVDTGITPNTGAGADWQLLRIEVYGPTSQLGIAAGGINVVRFLIDGEECARFTNVDVVRSAGGVLTLCAELDDTGHTALDELDLGPAGYGVNWLDQPVAM